MKAATSEIRPFKVGVAISIHAAREGGDRMGATDFSDTDISIHAAREGGDACATSCALSIRSFQSTPPVKAATTLVEYRRGMAAISIHAAREGGDYSRSASSALYSRISIHAAREGGDRQIRTNPRLCGEFQSTPPVKAATVSAHKIAGYAHISIHAAREGGDTGL